MKSNFHQLTFRQFSFVVIFLMLLVTILLLILRLNPSLQRSLKKVALGDIASVESNAFNRQTINELVLALRTNDAVVTKKLLEKNPSFLQSIAQEINSFSSVDEATNDEDITQKAELLELVFELRLSRKLIQQSLVDQDATDFDVLINNDKSRPFNAFLKHSSDAKALSKLQERLLSAIVRLKASDSSNNSQFNTQYFVSRYKQEKAKHSKYSLFNRGLLHASWLKQFVSTDTDTESESNLRDKFDLVSLDLNTDTDLIRLLNHKNSSVVITAAELVGFYLPENAINALRFQLVSSNDSMVKIALLDALSVYGTEARSVTKQLKSLLIVTKSDVIRNKINETISKLNGKFLEPQNNKA